MPPKGSGDPANQVWRLDNKHKAPAPHDRLGYLTVIGRVGANSIVVDCDCGVKNRVVGITTARKRRSCGRYCERTSF